MLKRKSFCHCQRWPLAGLCCRCEPATLYTFGLRADWMLGVYDLQVLTLLCLCILQICVILGDVKRSWHFGFGHRYG